MPTRPLLARIRKVLKQKIYRDQWVGGCHIVSRWLEIHYGFTQVFGCYVDKRGRHGEHCWNILPDGRILDATADQFARRKVDRVFGGHYGVYIGRSRQRRYIERCDCSNYYESQMLVRNARRMKTVQRPASVLLSGE